MALRKKIKIYHVLIIKLIKIWNKEKVILNFCKNLHYKVIQKFKYLLPRMNNGRNQK